MALTAKFVERVSEPGRYGDGRGGHGLTLNVHRTKDGRISRSWIQRLSIGGRVTHVGLGSFPLVTLAEARRAALANKRASLKGGDPRMGDVPTFGAALDKVLDIQRAAWRDGGKSEKQWRASLRDYAQSLMPMPVDRITTADVLAVLMQDGFWNARRETAKRVRQRIAKVLEWAIAQGHRDDNPAGPALGTMLPKNGVTKRHYRALHHGRVGAALATIRESGAWWATKAAIEFLTFTAGRSGEVRGARWSEVDMDAVVWVVPAERMKMNREHRVPLSPAALDVLREAGEHRDDSGLVFPSKSGRELSDVALSQVLKRLDIPGTCHGMRSSFRQWAAERTNFPREVAEHALAHVVGNEAERAYQRSDLFERRRDLMDSWARYVTAEPGDVVRLRA